MITLHFITTARDGAQTTLQLETRPGISLMQAAVAGNVDGIQADCGGLLTCATCHVYLQPPWLDRVPPASDEEQEMLDFVAAPRRPGSRLSCQLGIEASHDGLTVELPATQY